jgi:hypothetical protein
MLICKVDFSPLQYVLLFYLCRVAQVFSTIGFAAAGETVKLRITGYLGDLVMQSVTPQHTEMAMVPRFAITFLLVIH